MRSVGRCSASLRTVTSTGVTAAAIQVPAIQSCEVTAAAVADAMLAIASVRVLMPRSSSRSTVRGVEAIGTVHRSDRVAAVSAERSHEVDVVVVGAGLAGLAAARELSARGGLHGGAGGPRAGGGQGREPRHRRRAGGGGGRPVDRADAGPARRPRSDARRGDLPHLQPGKERDRVPRQPAPLHGRDPSHQPARADRRRAGPAPPQPAGEERAARGALGCAARGPAGLADGCDLDAAQRCHRTRADAARAGHRGRLGRPARGHVPAARALLHSLGGQPPDAVRHRGWGAAGPLRGRLAAHPAAHGRGARRGATRARRPGPPHRARAATA